MAIDPLEVRRLSALPRHLAQIRGQSEAIEQLSRAVQRALLGLSAPHRPRGSFLFVGPTGVGKGESVKLFTEYVFGPGHLCVFDGSEFRHRSAVEQLLGAGRQDQGRLGHALAGRTRGTLFFDEIEKAHPDVVDLFLQMLWDARVTVTTGATLQLAPFFIVCATNVGGAESTRMQLSSSAAVDHAVRRQLEQVFRPEFLGRFDELVLFRRLDFETQREICHQMVAQEVARLRALGYDLEVSREALEFLVRAGHDVHLGARPMQHTVERHLQDAVARRLLEAKPTTGRLRCGPAATGLVVMD